MAFGNGPAEPMPWSSWTQQLRLRAEQSSYCIYFGVSSGIAQNYPPGCGHYWLAISNHHLAFGTPHCIQVLGEQGGGSLMLCYLFVL